MRPGRRGRAAWGVLLVPALSLLAALPAPAQSAAEIAESRRRLEQIRRERAELGSKLTASEERVRTLSGELRTLDRRAGTSEQVLDELEFQLGARDAQVERTTRELVIARDRLGDRRAVLHRRLRSIYKRGPLHAVEVLLTAESFGELINRYKYLFLIARHDRQLVREVAALEAQLAGRERMLERTLAELEDVRTERSIALDQLGDARSARERALATARAAQEAATDRIAELERSERTLRALLAGLEARPAPAAGSAAAGAPAATLTTRDLGALAWPVQGDLLYRFGRATLPNGTAIRWNGIGIGAPTGTPVRAVAEGTVVMAGPFEGYGPTVVLSHGGGYYSLYLYLRQLSVREGDRVARNGVVGAVGGAATPEGPHLEFQIRGPGGEAVDPLAWLRAESAG